LDLGWGRGKKVLGKIVRFEKGKKVVPQKFGGGESLRTRLMGERGKRPKKKARHANLTNKVNSMSKICSKG